MRTKRKGAILVYALGIITVVSIVLLGLVSLIVSQAKSGYDVVAREKAFQTAESCTQEYRWYLAHNTEGQTIEEVLTFWNSTTPEPRGKSSAFVWDVKNPEDEIIGKCSARITILPIISSQPVTVEITGWMPEKPHITKKISVRFRRTSWSDYVVLTNEHAFFDNKWNITGRIMSNIGVQFDGVAHSRVYAGSASYYDPLSGLNKPGVWTSQGMSVDPPCEYNSVEGSCVFLGGKRYPVPQKDFAGIAVDLGVMKTASMTAGWTAANPCSYGSINRCYFDVPAGKEGKHITLRNDGKFDIVTVRDVKNDSNDIRSEEGASRMTRDIPQDGIIFIGGTVWVDGLINHSRVTIVAGEGQGNIYIGSGNLRYTNRDGTDVIGLIAKGNILLTSEKVGCPTCDDLEINAAMVAKDGKVGKENFNPNCCGSGCERQKNQIDIYGSVVSNKFVEFTASKACNGHGLAQMGYRTKNIVYDNNLFVNPPPFFPSDVYYTLDQWDEL